MNRPGGRPALGHAIKSWLIVGLLLATAAYCLAEELTLTTYYPSPRGVYQELRSTHASYFATNQGSVGIGTDAVPATEKLHIKGSAGIETDPTQPTSGQLLLGSRTDDPAALGEGAMYYNSQKREIRVFQKGAWTTFLPTSE